MGFQWVVGGILEARKSPEYQPAAASKKTGDKKKNPYKEQKPPEMPEKRKPAILASQIMHAPVRCLTTKATLEEARSLFQRSRFRHVPIVDEKGTLVGLVSDRDVLREAAQVNTKVDHWVAGMVQQAKTVEEFMTKRVLTATVGAEIRQIARAMFEERIGSMPIVDLHAKPIGIITRSDILRTIVNNAPLELWV